MFLDGWHFMEFLNVFSFCLLFGCVVQKAYNLSWYYMLSVGVGAYVLIGLFHSLFDGSLIWN